MPNVSSLFQTFLGWLEFFLPQEIKNRSLTHQFKARLAVLIHLQSILAASICFLTLFLLAGRLTAGALWALFFTVLFGLALGGIKQGLPFEAVSGVAFLFLSLWNPLQRYFFPQQVGLHDGLHYPLLVLFALLILRRPWALLIIASTALSTFFLYRTALWQHPELFAQASFDQFAVLKDKVLIVIYGGLVFAGILFSLLRRLTGEELKQENDWVMRGCKLHEISSYASGLGHQLSKPLEDLQWDLRHLKISSESSDVECQRISAMEQSVARMVMISRSLDWVYRPYQDEGPYSVAAKDLLKQLEVILGETASMHAWLLRTRCADDSLVIHGAIPAMVLLIVTLAHRVCEGLVPPRHDDPLLLEVGRKNEMVYWKLSWAVDASQKQKERESLELIAMTEEVRGSLIQELLRNCQATLRNVARNGEQQLVVASAVWGGRWP